MGNNITFVVSCVVVVNGQQHHVCRCALSLLIADGLIADGKQHNVCGVMRSRSWWATTSRLWCHALSFLLAEKIIFVVSGVVVAHCSFAPVIMATLWVFQWRMLSLCKKEEFQIMLCLCFPVAALYKILKFLLLLMGLGLFWINVAEFLNCWKHYANPLWSFCKDLMLLRKKASVAAARWIKCARKRARRF